MAKKSFGPSNGDRSKRVELDTDDFDEQDLLLDNEGDLDIDIEDDTPEEDRGRPTELDGSLADQEDDLRGVAEKTRKRIDRLRFETHTERRAREAAERQLAEAVEFASNQTKELEELRRRVSNGSAALGASMKEAQEARLADAKRRLSAAYAEGNGDDIAAATADMSEAQTKLVAISSRLSQQTRTDEDTRKAADDKAKAAPAQNNQQQLAPNVAAWISHNRSWFNRPEHAGKTAKAMSLHYDLVARGVNPSSEEYTRSLDKGLKSVYPEHEPFGSFDNDERGDKRGPRRSNAVTEGGRVSESQESKRKVTLTASQLAIAKKLGVTPQAYAQEVLKQRRREQGAGA